jgi:hypothetical protein
MSLFDTKNVKKCVCAKEPHTTIDWTGKDQVFAILLALGAPLTIVGIITVGSLSPEDYSGWVDPRLPIAILIATAAYFAYLVARNMKQGHKLKCSARQALYKV